jgi:hypothetical protein
MKRRAVPVVVVGTLLLAVAGCAPANTEGAPDAAAAAAAPAAPPPVNLSGVWTRDGRTVGPGELPLNKRGLALREAIDESLAPMYDCVPATVPHILGDPYNFSFEQQPDRVIQRFEKDAVTRTIWLEGHGHRPATANDYGVQGYSVGRYEGNTLVVESSKFTFDPGGLEDKPPMVPSSTSKKVVERYTRTGDALVVEAVMEDKLMMTAPVTFGFSFKPTPDAIAEWPECDPEQSRAPLNYLPVNQLKYGIR